jgi:hypothetical protein
MILAKFSKLLSNKLLIMIVIIYSLVLKTFSKKEKKKNHLEKIKEKGK